MKSSAIGSSCALGTNSRIVVVGVNDGTLVALDMDAGSRKWTFHIPTAGILPGIHEFLVVSSPVIEFSSSTVFIGASDKHGSVCAVDLESGEEKWCVHTGEGAVGAGVPGSPALDGQGRLYVGANDGNVHCLNASTGATLWQYQTGGVVYSSPALDLSLQQLYVGSNDGSLYCLSLNTGERKWSVLTEGWVDGSPAYSNSTVYFGYSNTNGAAPSVQAVNAHTGEVRTNSLLTVCHLISHRIASSRR